MVSGSLCSRKVICSTMVFQEFVVCLENVFEMSFVPHLWPISHSILGRVDSRVNGTLPR